MKVRVQVPSDSGYSNWNFNGQQVTTSLDPTATVRDLKQSLSSQLGGMPANKQQLKHPAYGFMKVLLFCMSILVCSHSRFTYPGRENPCALQYIKH